MKKQDKKNLDIKKIMSEINSLRKSLLNSRFQKSTGQLVKTSEIRKNKRKIANFLTILNKKENKNA